MKRIPKLLSTLSVIVSLALVGCVQQAPSPQGTSAGTEGTSTSAPKVSEKDVVSFSLKVDATQADKGMLYDKDVTAEEGTTVYDALVDTGLDLAVDSSSGSVYVDGIGGVIGSQTSSTAGWLYTVNGEVPMVGADSQKIEEGDQVVWTFYPDFTQASSI